MIENPLFQEMFLYFIRQKLENNNWWNYSIHTTKRSNKYTHTHTHIINRIYLNLHITKTYTIYNNSYHISVDHSIV